jgi:hypothetical protein
MGTLSRWFAYGLGAELGHALFGARPAREGGRARVRTGTEADFRADEKRFDEDERKLEAQSRGIERPSSPSGA